MDDDLRLSLPQLRDLAATGAEAVWNLAQAGRVGIPEAVNIARGALTYIEAVARGDVASRPQYDARLRVCGLCPHYTILAEDADKGETPGFCGTPGRCGMTNPDPTCGCMVRAKAAVKSARCPQGRWPDDPR